MKIGVSEKSRGLNSRVHNTKTVAEMVMILFAHEQTGGGRQTRYGEHVFTFLKSMEGSVVILAVGKGVRS